MQEKEINIEHWAAPTKQSKEDSWRQIQAKIASQEVKVVPLYRNVKWLSIAASLALLVAMVFFLNSPSEQTIYTANQERQIIRLPDGSKVTLNSASSLSYDAENWNDVRTVHLRGEAFFEVEKGKTFSVETDQGIVQVLGTSFNVYNRDNIFQVACKTGKVKVMSGSSSQILNPGFKTVLSENELNKPYSYSTEKIDQWLENGLYHFDNIPLALAFNELERHYNISIGQENISGQAVVNADVPLDNVELALDILTTAFNLDFEKKTANNYTVTNK